MWETIALWAQWLVAGDKAAQTVALRVRQLRLFAERYPAGPYVVTVDDLSAWLANPTWSTETRRSNRAALRSFFGWLHVTGARSDDPSRLLLPIKPGQARARPAPDPVIEEAMGRATPRVRLMILLGSRLGLRRAEIAQVHADDIVELLDGPALIVHGKGAKDRMVPMSAALAETIARRCRDEPGGWCFPGGDHGHLSPDYVGRIIARALPDGWSAHTLRHRFGTTAYAGTRDLAAVQELLGHSRPETTRRYIAVPSDALRAAVAAAA